VTTRTLSLASLAPLTGRGIRVAVVDSGVHQDHPHVGGISGGVFINDDGTRATDVASLSDRLGHGTAVAAAIREKAPNVELLAVKVFDTTLTATGQALVDAILWSIDEQVHIINLSLGTQNVEHRRPLEIAVQLAIDQGVLVVAAAPQPDAHWFPGALPGVIAVEADWECARDTCELNMSDDGRVTMRASAYPRPIPGVPRERNLRGPSFSVANATGFLALWLEQGVAKVRDSGVSTSSASAETDPTRRDR
jgi:subtilisin family serine protease